jgi:hypothetical protein
MRRPACLPEIRIFEPLQSTVVQFVGRRGAQSLRSDANACSPTAAIIHQNSPPPRKAADRILTLFLAFYLRAF